MALAPLLAGALWWTAAGVDLVTNGSFDTGTLEGWTPKAYLYGGQSSSNATDLASLGLTDTTAFTPLTVAIAAAEQSQTISNLSASERTSDDVSPLLPLAGAGCAGINLNGSAGQAVGLSANVTVSAQHFSPANGRLSVLMRVMPAFLVDGAVTPTQEAFALLAVDNLTKGKRDISRAYLGQGWAAQAGNPAGVWYLGQSNTIGTYNVRHWINLPLSVSLADAGEGDVLSVRAIATNASAKDNESAARLWVDSVEAAPTRPFMTAAMPDYVPASGNFNAQIAFDHGTAGGGTASLWFYAPNDTGLQAIDGGGAWQCSPSKDWTYVYCQADALPAGGSSAVTLRLQAGAQGKVPRLESYVFRHDKQTTQTGTRRVATSVSAAALANVSVVSARVPPAAGGDDVALSLVVRNDGAATASNVTLTDVASPSLGARTWTCTAYESASFAKGTKATGQGPISLQLNLPPHGSVTCLTHIAPRPGQRGGLVRYGGSLAMPATTNASKWVDATSADNEHATVFTQKAVASAAADDGSRAAGDLCADDGQCQSGFCTDGVCCQSRCDGACQACDANGSVGTCVDVEGSPHVGHLGCGPYVCHAGHCAGGCRADADCQALYHCDGGLCVADANACREAADCPAGRFCTPAHTCESPATQDANAPAWTLAGGCRHGGAGDAGGLLPLLGLALAAARRRRRALAAAAATVSGGLLAVSTALAASPLALPLERLQVLGGRHDAFSLASPRVARGLGLAHGQAQVHYLHQPLRLRSGQFSGVGQSVVPHLLALELGGGVSLSHGLEVDAMVPFVWHDQRPAPFLSPALGGGGSAWGLGDVRLTPKWTPLATRWLRLGVAVPVGVLTGHGGRFLSTGGVTVAPRMLLEAGPFARLRLLANAGYAVRPRRTVVGLEVGNGLQLSAAASYVPPGWGRACTVLLAAVAELPLPERPHGLPVSVEGLVGLRARVSEQWSLEADAGLPLTHAPGQPKARALVALRFAARPSRPVAAPTEEPAAAGAAEPAPPAVPSVPPPELEGPPFVPSPPSPVDVPLVPLLPPASAAPPAAAAPAVPAPPATDDDDALPLLLPPPAAARVPVRTDRDGDGVWDDADACPDVAAAGSPTGCPPTLEAANEALAARDVSFEIRGDYAVIDAAGLLALEQVRQIVQAHARVPLRLAGHVPQVAGKAPTQLEHLSQRRAEDVARWLTLNGVDSGRLRLEGRGASQPLDGQPPDKSRRVTVRLEPASAKGAP